MTKKASRSAIALNKVKFIDRPNAWTGIARIGDYKRTQRRFRACIAARRQVGGTVGVACEVIVRPMRRKAAEAGFSG